MQTPAPNTNVVPSMPTDQGTPPTQQNLQKFLDFLGKAEGADYNVIVGGKTFQDFSRHPGVVGLRTKEGPSTAAGKYQITQTTYNDIAPKLGIKDFSPESQDRIAIELIRQKGAFEDVQKGDFRSAIDKLGATWASLPSSPYTQPKRSWEFAQTTLGVPLGTPTQRTQVASRTQKATAGVSPTAKKGVQFASLGALPESYRTALALNFIADSDPEDEVISKAIEVLRTTQEDTGAAKTPGGDMLQKYVRGQEGVDPFQFLERKEEPEPRLRRSKMRNLAAGGEVQGFAEGGSVSDLSVGQKARMRVRPKYSQEERDWIAARESEFADYNSQVKAYNEKLAEYQKQVDAYNESIKPYQKEVDAYQAEVDKYNKAAEAYRQSLFLTGDEARVYEPLKVIRSNAILGMRDPTTQKQYRLGEYYATLSNEPNVYIARQAPTETIDLTTKRIGRGRTQVLDPSGAVLGTYSDKDPIFGKDYMVVGTKMYKFAPEPGQFTAKLPVEPPPEFSVAAPVAPTNLPYTQEQVQDYISKANARAQRSAKGRAIALQVATDPTQYGLSSFSSTSMFSKGGEAVRPGVVPSMAEVPVIGPDGRLMLPEEVPERELSIPEKLRGALETGATIATVAVAAPIAAVTGLARGKNIKEANVEAGKVLEAMTYQPRSEAGRRYLEAFGKAMQESKLDALLPQAQLLNVRVAPGAARYLGEQAKGKVEAAVMPGLRERAGDPNLTPEQVYGAMLGKPSEVMAEAGATYATRPLGAYGDVGKDVDIFSRRMENYATDAYLEANDFAENLRSQIDLNSRRLRDAKKELERVAAMSPDEFRQTQAIDPNLNQPVLLRDGEILNLRHRIQELEGQETALQNRYAQETDRAAIFNNFGPQVQQVQQKADDYFSTTFGTVKDPLYKAFMEGRWTPSTIDELDVVARLPKALRDALGDRTSLEEVRRLAREGTPGEQEQATIALSNLYDSIAQQTGELVSPYTDLGFLMNPEAKKLAVPALQDYLEDIGRSFMDATTDDDAVRFLKKDPELIRRAITNQYADNELAKSISDSVLSQLDTIDLKQTLDALGAFREARTLVIARKRENRLHENRYYERGENPEFSFENVQKAIDEVYLPTLREYYDTQADPTSGKLGTTLDPRSVAMAKTLYHLVGTPEMKKKSLKEIEAELRDYTSSKPGKNPWRYSADTLTPEEIVMRNSRDFVQMVMPDVYTSFYNDVLERQGAKTSAIEISPSQELRDTMAKGEDFDASSAFASPGSPQSFKSSIDALNAAIKADPKYAEAVKRGMPVFKLDSNVLWDTDYSPFDMADIAEYAASLPPTELRNKSFADLVVGSQSIWSNLDNPKTILNRMEKNRPLTPEQKLLGTTRTSYDIPIVNTRDLGNNYGVAGWHQITSPDGVKAEGIMANHCMAQPSYYNQFLDGRSRFYTLRDSMGQPRLTIQMLNERADTEGPPGIPSDQVPGNQFNVVAQIKGNFNNPDAEMYESEVNDFFRNYMRENNLTSMKFTERDDFLTPALRGEEPL
jgi:tetratricopeptide (TPR) repeat protein